MNHNLAGRAYLLLLSFFFITETLFSKPQDNNEDLVNYDACFLSNNAAIYNSKNSFCLAISKHKKVCHTPFTLQKPSTKKDERNLKYDPYLRLSLLQTDIELEPVTFKSIFNYKPGDEFALIDSKKYELTHFKSYSNGLEVQSKLTSNNVIGKALGVKCFKCVGFGSIDNTFISSDLLMKFAASNDIHYGDIGIRLDYDKKKNITVKYRDLFFEDNNFLVGDQILSVEHKNVKNLNQVSRQILDLPYNKKIVVKIKRAGEILRITTIVRKRYGGGYLPDLFVERFGLFFDKKFSLINVDEKTIIGKKRLINGDKLLQVDRHTITTHKALKDYISNKSERRTSLLFERNGFQFFLILE
jgi:hypothetical protein